MARVLQIMVLALPAACGGGGSTAVQPQSNATQSGSSAPASSSPTSAVNAAVTVTPAVAAIASWQSATFAASVSGGAAADWSVDGIAGGNATVGTITSAGVFTPGTATGSHTITATSAASATQSGSAEVAVTPLPGVYTYRNDLARDGANTQEYALTPAAVSGGSFHKLFACTADGAIYGQPLWVADLTINGAAHNVVFVATAHDSLFAFDADASPCVTLWKADLIDTSHGAASGETTVPSGPTGYLVGQGHGDITPETGVIGTPVIDPGSGTLYVVSKSVDSTHSHFYQRLHAINLTNGNEKTGSPLTVSATATGTGDGGTTDTFNSRTQLQRCGLALVNGVIYVSWASHEDVAPYYGWVLGYTYNGSAFSLASKLNAAPNGSGGESGIWMSGGAPAADSTNHLYVITGNGAFSPGSSDYGDSLLQLSSSLAVTQYFTPSDELNDQTSDADFGAGGAVVLADLPAGSPVTHLLLGGGKDGSLYVLNRDTLGGLDSSPTKAVQQLPLGHGIFASGAFWNNTFYIAAASSALTAWSLDTATAQFSAAPQSPESFAWPGTTPSISAAGAQSGVVWALDTSAYCTSGSAACGPAVLRAYDATNLARELWNSSTASGDAAGNAVKFAVPMIANGKVYVGTRGNNAGGAYGSTTVSGELDVYGLAGE